MIFSSCRNHSVAGDLRSLSPEKILSLVWGQGQAAPEASAGIPVVMESPLPFRHRKREARAPALSTKKSVPHDSKRNGLAPRPWERCALTLDFSPSKLGHHPSLNDSILPTPFRVWLTKLERHGSSFVDKRHRLRAEKKRLPCPGPKEDLPFSRNTTADASEAQSLLGEKFLKRNLTFFWPFVIFSAKIDLSSFMKKRPRFLNLKMGKRITQRPKPWAALPKKKAAKKNHR